MFSGRSPKGGEIVSFKVLASGLILNEGFTAVRRSVGSWFVARITCRWRLKAPRHHLPAVLVFRCPKGQIVPGVLTC